MKKYIVPQKLKRQTVKLMKLEKLYLTAKEKLAKEEIERGPS